MTVQLRLLIAAGLFALGLLAGWGAQGWRMGEQLAEQRTEHQAQLRRTAEASAQVIRDQQGRLTTLGTTTATELTHARTKNDRLERLYAAADAERHRLRIEVRQCGPDQPAAAGGVGDATTVELSPAAGRAVWDLRRALIEDRAKLTYLQGYVCALQPAYPGCADREASAK